MHTNLVEIIKNYSGIEFDKRFDWDFSRHDLPADIVNDLPEGNAFKKNIALKERLSKYLPDKTKKIEYWIIQKWGGIWRFKRNDRNDKNIDALYSQLKNHKLKNNVFGCISSFSKVASFYKPNEYAIYDSRAIFSLNWLLLKSGETKNFFPVPTGQNTAIANYDIETVIRLRCGEKNDLFYKPNDAYFKYCELLKKLSIEIWSEDERKGKPYYLEMLLFVIGPEEIVSDMKKSIKIEI